MELNGLCREARSVIERFLDGADAIQAYPHGRGHINDTFRVTCRLDGVERQVLLQRINHQVFRRPELVMHNIRNVTGHIVNKLTEAGVRYEGRRALRLLPTLQGEAWFRAGNGSWWRAFDFVEGSVMVEEIAPQSVRAAGEAYGRFQAWLADYEGPKLVETIPRFHDTPDRLRQLRSVVDQDPCSRASEARGEIDRCCELAELAGILADLERDGGLPRRIAHNDAKLDNILFDEVSGEALCVVDLDTVMPGTVLHDFGDMVRSMSSPTAEDEEDLAKVGAREDLFRALVGGYLSTANTFLTEVERDHLVRAGQVLTFELVVRFLTDFLEGDTYFKVHRPQHNLIRTKSQLRLLETLLDCEERFTTIVADEVAAL